MPLQLINNDFLKKFVKLYKNGKESCIMKKFINATIYGNPESREILVENNQFKAIGNDLRKCR